MAFVLKGNKQLTVLDEKVTEFLKMGYSEVNKEGEILQVGEATDLKDIKAENDTLKAKLAEYKENIDKLDQCEAIQAENVELKAQLEAATKKGK